MQIDARDLFNPKPVVMALEALSELSEGETLAVLVNDGKAVESLMHLAEEEKCRFTREDEGDYAVVTLEPTRKIVASKPLEEAVNLMGLQVLDAPVVVFGSDRLGSGDDTVGRILANEIIFDLCYQEVIPSAIVLYNSGVNLALEGAETVESLSILVEHGCEVLVDSVSLERFGAFAPLAVGEEVDPYIIGQVLTSQPGVISL